MLAPIYFNNDLPVEADKVDDEVFDWSLPAKYETDEASVPQQPPHRQFGVGRATAHGFRKIAILFRNWPMLKSLRHRPLTRLGPSALATLSRKGRG